jgi:hypothetical protein
VRKDECQSIFAVNSGSSTSKKERGLFNIYPMISEDLGLYSQWICLLPCTLGDGFSARIRDMEDEMARYGGGATVFDGHINQWVLDGWKRLVYVPRKFSPCFESGIAVHESGHVAYVAEFAKRLVEISFEW